MNGLNQDHQQQQQQQPAQATSKAGPSKAEQLRGKRAGVVPATAEDVCYMVCADGKSAVFLWREGGKPFAVAYPGASCKRAWGFYFASDDKRADRVSDWMIAQDNAHSAAVAKKAARKAQPHGLTVGDILSSSWGYDQTNVDFYEVVAVRGSVVDLREIRKEITEGDGGMYGKCVGIAGAYCGEVIKSKRVGDGGYIKITSSEYAGPWDGKPRAWTAYH